VRLGCRCRKVWLTRIDYYYYYCDILLLLCYHLVTRCCGDILLLLLLVCLQLAVEYHKRFDPIYSDARNRARQLGPFSYYYSYMAQPKQQLDTFRWDIYVFNRAICANSLGAGRSP
jgi:hypothetical protein